MSEGDTAHINRPDLYTTALRLFMILAYTGVTWGFYMTGEKQGAILAAITMYVAYRMGGDL